MADNVDITPGTGATVAADLVGGALYQRVKLALGADGAAADAALGGGTEATALRVTVASDSTGVLSIDDNGGAITVDGTVAVTNADITSCKTALELLDNSVDGAYLNINANIAGTDFVGGAGAVAAGVQRTTLASDDPAVVALQIIDDSVYVDDADWTDNTSKHLLVGGVYQSAPHTVTDGDVSPLEVDVNGRLVITGQTARDAAVATTPVLSGASARALSGTTSPTAVNADADAVDLLASRQGVQYVHPHGAYILSGTHAQAAEAHTDVEVIAAVADLAFHITDVIFSTDTDATTMLVECDTAAAKTVLIGKMYFKSGGGCALHFTTPIRATLSKNVGFTTTTSSTGSITISGYYAP